MSVLDQVLGSVMAEAGGGASPIQGILANLLGGNQVGGFGNQPGAGTMGGAARTGGMGGGGLSGLVNDFERAGLGHIMQSWVSSGPNEAVSPQQLQTVFGQDRVHRMADQAGLQPNDLLTQLSQHLPRVVDGMTPNGRLPNDGTVSV